MSKQLPDYYLYSACTGYRATPRFEVLDVFRFDENFVLRSRKDIRKPSANIAYLLLERQYRKQHSSDVRDVANSAWRIAFDIERGPQSETAELRARNIRRAINRRLTLLEDEEYLKIYGI